MIRRFVFALSLSTALCAPLYAGAETLADTVNQALQTHPQIKEGAAAMKAADKNIHEQRSGYFPELSLESESGRVHNNDFTTRADTASQGASSSWKQGETVTITQPLFTGFSVENHVSGAQARYSAAEFNLTGTEEDVALRAARAHLNLMRTRELLDLASDYLSNIEKRRKSIALMVKEGAADAAELLQADEVVAGAKNTRLGYEESYRQAEADYIEVTGSAPLKKLEFGDRSWNGILPKTLDDAIAYATKRNAHILAADSMVTAASKDREAEKSSLMPHVDAEMSYTKDNQRYAVGDYTEDAQAIVKIAWNFDMGGGQRYRIDRLGEEQNQAFAKRQEAMRTVEHDTRQKYTSMEIVDQQFALLTERQRASENILKNFEAQFEGGKQTNLQLINAHSRLFEAKAARVDAYYRQLLSRFELLNAMGRLREAFGAVKSPVEVKPVATPVVAKPPVIKKTEAKVVEKPMIATAASKTVTVAATKPAVTTAVTKTAAAPASKSVVIWTEPKTVAAVATKPVVTPAATKAAAAATPRTVTQPVTKATAIAANKPVVIWSAPKATVAAVAPPTVIPVAPKPAMVAAASKPVVVWSTPKPVIISATPAVTPPAVAKTTTAAATVSPMVAWAIKAAVAKAATPAVTTTAPKTVAAVTKPVVSPAATPSATSATKAAAATTIDPVVIRPIPNAAAAVAKPAEIKTVAAAPAQKFVIPVAIEKAMEAHPVQPVQTAAIPDMTKQAAAVVAPPVAIPSGILNAMIKPDATPAAIDKAAGVKTQPDAVPALAKTAVAATTKPVLIPAAGTNAVAGKAEPPAAAQRVAIPAGILEAIKDD